MADGRRYWNVPAAAAALGCWLAAASCAHAVTLGAAGGYVAATLNGNLEFVISSGATSINGDIFVGNGSSATDLKFSGGGSITGTVYKDPSATTSLSGGSAATGGIVALTAAQSAQVKTDVLVAVATISALAASPTQTFSSITDNLIINRTGTVNVIQVTNNIQLQNTETLTINGQPGDVFIFNVLGKILTSGTGHIDAVGIGAAQVLFAVGQGISMLSDGITDGTYIVANGGIRISNGTHYGAFIQGGANSKLRIDSGVELNFAGFTLPPSPTAPVVPVPGSVPLFVSGLALLGWLARRGKRVNPSSEGPTGV
jgi:hypothetical protein